MHDHIKSKERALISDLEECWLVFLHGHTFVLGHTCVDSRRTSGLAHRPVFLSQQLDVMSSLEVVLGFLDDAQSWRLRSPQFPSKVGGKPAWLCQRDLPSLDRLECETCRLPMAFLLQVSNPESGVNQVLIQISRVIVLLWTWNRGSTFVNVFLRCTPLSPVRTEVSTEPSLCFVVKLHSATHTTTAAVWKVCGPVKVTRFLIASHSNGNFLFTCSFQKSAASEEWILFLRTPIRLVDWNRKVTDFRIYVHWIWLINGHLVEICEIVIGNTFDFFPHIA